MSSVQLHLGIESSFASFSFHYKLIWAQCSSAGVEDGSVIQDIQVYDVKGKHCFHLKPIAQIDDMY